MFYSIISPYDVFFPENDFPADDRIRSSNPYDYIRKGFYIDNAALYGGKNYVDFNSNFPSYRTGASVDFSGIGKWSQRNIP